MAWMVSMAWVLVMDEDHRGALDDVWVREGERGRRTEDYWAVPSFVTCLVSRQQGHPLESKVSTCVSLQWSFVSF